MEISRMLSVGRMLNFSANVAAGQQIRRSPIFIQRNQQHRCKRSATTTIRRRLVPHPPLTMRTVIVIG
jgi:hypothetical protein